ncbi:hypothetical protein [Okeania sp. KiyG1]|nr:hypothetical protein [Okeania sp. KiyG1]
MSVFAMTEGRRKEEEGRRKNGVADLRYDIMSVSFGVISCPVEYLLLK